MKAEHTDKHMSKDFEAAEPELAITCMTSMSCLRSSPSLKIIPTGVAVMGEGIGQNSSHNGFFLEAITLHLSSLKTDRITRCAMLTQSSDKNI